MSSYDIAEVEDYFQPILERIAKLFGAPLVVDDYDEEWVQFHLPGLLDQPVIVTIEIHNHQILIGDEQQTFQILCPWSPADGKGLWLHYLSDSRAQAEYRAGAWFY